MALATDWLASARCGWRSRWETHACVTAERAFLSAMGGGCNLAVGAYAQVIGAELQMRVVSHLDRQPQRAEASQPVARAIALGEQLAALLRKK